MPGLILNIDVPDIGAGIAFYSETIDVTVGRRIDVGFVELLGAETKVDLLKKATGTAIGPPNGGVLRYDTGGARPHPRRLFSRSHSDRPFQSFGHWSSTGRAGLHIRLRTPCNVRRSVRAQILPDTVLHGSS